MNFDAIIDSGITNINRVAVPYGMVYLFSFTDSFHQTRK